MSTAEKPLPDVNDPLTAAYWQAARERRLVVPRCDTCQQVLWPPEPVCPDDYQSSFSWEEWPQTGTLWSYAVYHRALDPAFAGDIPYAVGLVELAGGVKMYGTMRGPLEELAVGMPVQAVFEDVDDEVTLVRWTGTRED